ncbi:MAG: ATP-binding protein, partial [Nitrospina sp.]|nr:ATP-binding protein [Nitrospina sp.]
DDKKVQIRIKDTGMGIPKEMIEDIFEPFTRLDRDKIKVEGVGIGLSITKQLLDTMNGVISVESTLGEGSCFTVELPLAKT